MRILVFTGGLGNQIFEYAFYLHLKKYFPKDKIYGHYGKKLQEHYGMELNKWFDVELPKEKWWVLPVVGMFYFYKQIFPKSKHLDLHQRQWINKNAIVYFPFKFCNKYFPNDRSWIKWKIIEESLSTANKELLNKIRSNESCFLHVRRGDYLSPTFKTLFEGCCSINYYISALSFINQKKSNILFICFSDDMDWVKKNLPIGENAIYVDWNTGEDSPIDMFLMSQCKNGIMANSTFSYWGAYLGEKKGIVTYPSRWWNSKEGNPEIFFNEWIGF